MTLKRQILDVFEAFLEEVAKLSRQPGLRAEVVTGSGLPWLTFLKDDEDDHRSVLKALPMMFGPTDVVFVFHFNLDGIRGNLRQTFQTSRLTPELLSSRCLAILETGK